MVTGNADSSGAAPPADAALLPLSLASLPSPPQAARTGATARTERPARKRRREVFMVLLGWGDGSRSGREGAGGPAGGGLLEQRREPLEGVGAGQGGVEVEGAGQRAVGVDGPVLPDGRQRADRAEVLEALEHLLVLGGEDDDVGVDEADVLRGDLGLRAPLGCVLVQAGRHREAELG